MALFGRSASVLFENDCTSSPSWPSNWHPSPIKRENVLFILQRLNKLLPHDRWYIGGSMASPEVAFKDCGDIDIFFYTMDDYTLAQTAFADRNDCTLEQTSGSAETYKVRELGLFVQLIKRHTGSPKEIFSTFDLNVAKYLVRSDGQQIEGPGSSDLIRVVNPNAASISRVQKYMKYLRYDSGATYTAWRQLIDDHIGNGDIMEDYYDGSGNKLTNKVFNKMLYNRLKHDRSIKYYLNKQALEHAPELLI